MSPLVVPADAEKVMADYLATAVPTLTDPAGFTYEGTERRPGATPTDAVMCRHIGGSAEGRTHTRPAVDVLVWADGTIATRAQALSVARQLHGLIRRDLRSRTVAVPTLLPDPADPSKRVALFTVELLIKGAQP